MLESIPHKKFYLYHVPTRGQVGIKFGMLDTSPTYLQFLIVPCYYIIFLDVLYALICYFILFFGQTY